MQYQEVLDYKTNDMKTLEELQKELKNKIQDLIKSIEKSDTFVEDFSGCNFKLLFRVGEKEVHTFEHSGGVGLCVKEDGERFKHCKAVI